MRKYREIGIREKKWIETLLNVNFLGRDILINQFSEAEVYSEQGYSYISIKTRIKKDVEKYPYDVRVPIEMHAFQLGSAPIVFLLHVIDGVIDELEVLTADSSRIDVDSISVETVEYVVNKKVEI